MMSVNRSRRRFLLSGVAVGGGLIVGYGLFKPRDLLGPADILPVTDTEIALNAWLKIAADGVVTVAVPRAEMGQGVYTALPMLVAEELEVAWSNIRVVQSPIDKLYGNIVAMENAAPFDYDDDGWLASSARWSFGRLGRALGIQITGGSTSVRDAWLPMRTAGAAARAMLLATAAARFGVPVSQCEVATGVIRHLPSQRQLYFGDLAADAAKLDPPRNPRLKPPEAYKLIGHNAQRLDIPSKVDGSAQFAIDVRPEGLLYAAIRICPVFGGRVAGVDSEAARDMTGVIEVVTRDDAVIVIADQYWRARKALAAIEITYTEGEHAELDSATLESRYDEAMADGGAFTYENKGDAETTLERSANVHEATYRAPLLAHACMEPMNCTALVTATGCEIWSGNQAPGIYRQIAATVTGHDEQNVIVHSTLLGGGFGRRAEPDVLLQTIAAAAAVPGRPVQLIWSREDDIQHDTYRPAALSRFRATLDANGNLAAWSNRIVCPSVNQAAIKRTFPSIPAGGPDRTNVEGAAFLAYDVPECRVEHVGLTSPVPVGFWRSVGHSYNAFFTESFIDELAHAASRDPLEFRLAHVAKHPRETTLLRLLARKSGWDSTPPAEHARGIAFHESFGSLVGQVAEVSLVDGGIRVHKVVCVIDCGRAINPDIVVAQMESGIIFGLTAALYGEITLAAGRVEQSNFPDYRMLPLARTPLIETHVIENGHEPGGVGEPATPPIAPAVANALFALTGKRLRSLPLHA